MHRAPFQAPSTKSAPDPHMAAASLPPCKYGKNCYRKNPQHLFEFSHPSMVDDAATDDDEDARAPPAKKPKASVAPAAPALPTAPAAPAASGAGASSSAATGAPKAVLIFAPGAGGTTAKDMRANVHRLYKNRNAIRSSSPCTLALMLFLYTRMFLYSRQRVYRLDDEALGTGETRWNTAAPSSAGNLDHVIAVANRAAAANPGAPLLLCGASFGNRVLAELLASPKKVELLPKGTASALLCCGYPLNVPGKPDGADPKRANHLKRIPPGNTVAFVQGDQDEFNGPRGLDALRDVMAAMACDHELHPVPGGVHTVPMAKGLKALGLTQTQVTTQVCDIIEVFALRVCRG